MINRKLASYRDYYRTGREQAVHHGVFPKVVFAVPTPERRAEIGSLIQAQPPEARRLFGVVLGTEAAAMLISGGPEPVDGVRQGAAA